MVGGCSEESLTRPKSLSCTVVNAVRCLTPAWGVRELSQIGRENALSLTCSDGRFGSKDLESGPGVNDGLKGFMACKATSGTRRRATVIIEGRAPLDMWRSCYCACRGIPEVSVRHRSGRCPRDGVRARKKGDLIVVSTPTT